MIAFARALEIIPRQLCDNAGFDATDVLNKLRQKHALKDGSGKHFGVDVNTGVRSASCADAARVQNQGIVACSVPGYDTLMGRRASSACGHLALPCAYNGW